MRNSACALLFAASIAVFQAGAQPVRIPVTVTSAAKEQMARHLSRALSKELERDPRFRLVDRPSPQVLDISMPAGVGWERRLDWTEIQYQARLNSPSGQSVLFAGRCWNWNLAACAKQILDAAARMAAAEGPSG